MKMKTKLSLVLVIATVALSLWGCSRSEKEQNNKQLDDDATITLYQHESGETVEITLGEYLCGVVAGEMDVNWPQEALAAQAIVARTFTLEKIEDGGVPARGTDASTDIHEFQAYQPQKINDKVRKAVEETSGKAIYYNGNLIKAWFFADGGGKTAASAVEGLSYDKEETPYIQSVTDPGIELEENENKQWSAEFTMAEVTEAVEKVSGQKKEKFTQVSIVEHGDSGRATKMQFDDLIVGVPALRLALGGEKMKSALLTEVKIVNSKLYLTGKGYGHGVGMSQWGARALAEQGKTAEEIIHYFFKNIEIR
ncbi:MAG: SpoIID/LytB domain-containing protein [Peptococcaceae bacterium]|nr:SpoIID/LytB domain-containing protein [Peptococcaceae bacterium]